MTYTGSQKQIVFNLEAAYQIVTDLWMYNTGNDSAIYSVYKYLQKQLNEEKEKSMYHPITQKGKGLNELWYNGQSYIKNRFESAVAPVDVQSASKFLDIYYCEEFSYPRFARPCPLVPRHGFVDSRVVHNASELQALATETLADDSQAEIALMSYIESNFNAIVQPGRLTVGPGHDGATAGNDAVTIMLRGDGGLIIDSVLVKSAGVKNSPYFEVVYSNGSKYDKVNQPYVVQLRDGPVLPSSIDYVPVDTLVKQVIKVNGEDLLAWEKVIKDNRGTDGLVIWHPGGAMSSHYSIHAVVAKIPVLISFEPKVGDTVWKIEDSEDQVIDFKQLKSGFTSGIVDRSIGMEEAFRLVLTISKLLKNPDSYILGYGMGLSYRLSLVASIGERRHLSKKGKNQSRDYIYSKAWNRAGAFKHRMTKLYEDFLSKSWNHGYGGEAWGNIAKNAHILYNAIVDEDDDNALFAFNNLVDSHHNNNWFGDKFISVDSFKNAGYGYYGSAVNSAPLLYNKLSKIRVNFKWTWKRLKPLFDGPVSAINKVVEISYEGGRL